MGAWTTAELLDHLLRGERPDADLIDTLLQQRLREDHLFDWKVGVCL